MFCKNCGSKLSDGTKFCSACGAPQDTAPVVQSVQPTQPTAPVQNLQGMSQQKPKSRGKKIGGIVMAVLGGLSILGSFANDYYWNIAHNGVNMSDFITIGLQIGLVVGGGYLIYKSKIQG